MLLNDQVNGHIYEFLADLLYFQHIQVNRLDFNAWKSWQTCHFIELSEYKLYMGHIHTLVLTREWIAMLDTSHNDVYVKYSYITVLKVRINIDRILM